MLEGVHEAVLDLNENILPKDVLVETQMILGNPHKGEVTGYKHAVGDRTIVFIRNPSLRPQSPTMTFQLGARAQAFLFKEHFTLLPEKRAPKIRRIGPRRL